MDRLLTYLARLFRIVIGYAAALFAASLFLHLLLAPALMGTMGEPVSTLLVTVAFLASLIGYFAFLPALTVITLAEAMAWRGFLFHSFAGAVVGAAATASYRGSGVVVRESFDVAASPFPVFTEETVWLAFFASGLVGGIVYWLVAGRSAGSWRDARAD